MYYTNQMKVVLRNNETATIALEIMKVRLNVGFDCDKEYRRLPSMLMHDDLYVVDNTIELPDDCGHYSSQDAETIICELMQDLAAHLHNETFTFAAYNTTDYDEGWIEGNYENGELKIKATYFPSGYSDLYCQECGEQIATMEDYENGVLHIVGNTYVCPACGDETDLSDWLPTTSQKTIKIK